MKFLMAIAGFIIGIQAANANIECRINKNRGDGNYDKEVYRLDLFEYKSPADVQIVYFKRNGKIVHLNWQEVLDKKDFSDLHQAKYLSMKVDAPNTVSIVVGDVNVHRRDIRKMASSTTAHTPVSVITNQYWAICK